MSFLVSLSASFQFEGQTVARTVRRGMSESVRRTQVCTISRSTRLSFGHTWSTLTRSIRLFTASLDTAIRLTTGPKSVLRYSLNCRHFSLVFISSELPQMIKPSAPRSVIFRKVASRSACGGKFHFPRSLIARFLLSTRRKTLPKLA